MKCPSLELKCDEILVQSDCQSTDIFIYISQSSSLLPMSWVYGHFKYVSAGNDFRRQNPLAPKVDPTLLGLK